MQQRFTLFICACCLVLGVTGCVPAPPAAEPKTPTAEIETPTAEPETPTAEPETPTAEPEPWTRAADGMVMVFVSAGEFEMGSDDSGVDTALELCETYGVPCVRQYLDKEQPRTRWRWTVSGLTGPR